MTSRYIVQIEIKLSNNDQTDTATLKFNGKQWSVEGSMYPRDIRFIQQLQEFMKEHKSIE